MRFEYKGIKASLVQKQKSDSFRFRTQPANIRTTLSSADTRTLSLLTILSRSIFGPGVSFAHLRVTIGKMK